MPLFNKAVDPELPGPVRSEAHDWGTSVVRIWLSGGGGGTEFSLRGGGVQGGWVGGAVGGWGVSEPPPRRR